MSHLQGFLWSMGRCGMKAISDTIRRCTPADVTNWVDAPRLLSAQRYYFLTYPKPFVFVMHQPQYAAKFSSVLAANRQTPVIFVVRDPLPNLISCAKTFLTSFVARRVDDIARHVAQGNSVACAINPDAITEWLIPMVDYWGHWNAVEKSPYLLVDFDDLSSQRYVETLSGICEFLKLEITSPIVDSGPANLACDVFFAGYVRNFAILDRSLELRFSRWDDYWNEPGLTRIGQISSDNLAPILGGSTRLNVHVRADQALCEGRFTQERIAFALLAERDEVVQPIVAQVLKDYRDTLGFVERDLLHFQALVQQRFEAKYGHGLKRFYKTHPHIAEKWTSYKLARAS